MLSRVGAGARALRGQRMRLVDVLARLGRQTVGVIWASRRYRRTVHVDAKDCFFRRLRLAEFFVLHCVHIRDVAVADVGWGADAGLRVRAFGPRAAPLEESLGPHHLQGVFDTEAGDLIDLA